MRLRISQDFGAHDQRNDGNRLSDVNPLATGRSPRPTGDLLCPLYVETRRRMRLCGRLKRLRLFWLYLRTHLEWEHRFLISESKGSVAVAVLLIAARNHLQRIIG